MIDYEKLDALMELPISEEMLGAYLEGNLHGAELREVQNIVDKDSFVADLISSTDDVMQMNNDLRNYLDAHQYTYEYYENDGGHIWRNWRIYLTMFAQKIFKE